MDTKKKSIAGSSSPGESQLGHKPGSKVKLEGPKRHHDDHGPKDSIPMKGSARAIPGQHWERLYDGYDPSRNMILVEGSDFNPKCPGERKTTHIKVNETDH
jgi:hypothetical protein